MSELKIADTRAAKRAKRDEQPIPDVDESVRKEARNVGLLAVLFAAGISAQALYALGLLIGLSPWTAWMLPGAMDLYAFESTRVASRVPARHPSRSWAVWNARLALSFTVAGNALFHALHLAGSHRGWTNTDIALTAVSAIPPVIVERFLHLQTKINASSGATTTAPETARTAAGRSQGPKRSNAQNETPERSRPTPDTNGTTDRTDRSQSTAAIDRTAIANDPEPDRAETDTERSNGTATGRPSTERWVEVGRPVYETLAGTLGRRPPEKAYRDALAAEAARLIAAGQLPAYYADPSVPAAKRVRAAVEERFPGLARLRPVPDDLEEAS